MELGKKKTSSDSLIHWLIVNVIEVKAMLSNAAFTRVVLCTATILSVAVLIYCDAEEQVESSDIDNIADDREQHPLGDGHKKPFGKGKPSTHVQVIDRQVLGSEFFSKIVEDHNPIVFKRLYKDSLPVMLWTDEYFLKLKNLPDEHRVTVEGRKKENRSTPAVSMRFQEFVEVYNLTDQYMVEGVPQFLW